jgi:hypothetical protein
MKLLPQGLVLILILFLSGCLFDHAVSEKPSRKIDEMLLGVWDGSNGSELTISRFDADHYKIEMTSMSGEVRTTIHLLGHHAATGGKDVVWLRWTPPEQNSRKKLPKWLPCTYALGVNDQLNISVPKEENLPLLDQAAASIQKGTAEALGDYYKAAIPRDDFFHPLPTRYTRRDKRAEQDRVDQPAIVPESKSESKNQPQSKSKESSR